MTNGKNYQEELHCTACGEQPVTIRNLTPVSSAQEKEKIKFGIRQTLYEVFSKHC